MYRMYGMQIGETYGNWKVISAKPRRVKSPCGSSKLKYLVKCQGCGEERHVFAESLRNGKSRSCGKPECLIRDKDFKKSHPRRFSMEERAINELMGVFKRRKHGFGLEREYFITLIKGSCFYCGQSPSNIWRVYHNAAEKADRDLIFYYSGLDRLDSSKGYYKDNVVSCCKRCNLAKSSMSLKEFLDWLSRISNHVASMMAPLKILEKEAR